MTWPSVDGYEISTPAIESSSPASICASEPILSAMPSGSARVGRVVDPERGALLLGVAEAHVHRLGGGGRLVEQRRVGHRQRGEVFDHLLEVDQRLEPAL